jgi:hypothetical protein
MKRLTYVLILMIAFASCKQSDNGVNDNMNADRNNKGAANEKRMAEFYEQVMNAHNPAMVDSFCTADYVENTPFPGYSTDRDGLKKGFTDWMAAFPDLTVKTDWIKSWGDTVVAKFHMKGSNTGMFMGAPATNKSIDVDGIDVVVLRDGKAFVHWGYSEEAKMMNQLGMGSPPPTAMEEKEHH